MVLSVFECRPKAGEEGPEDTLKPGADHHWETFRARFTGFRYSTRGLTLLVAAALESAAARKLTFILRAHLSTHALSTPAILMFAV